jgi:predicted PurR-regulated permease PerM
MSNADLPKGGSTLQSGQKESLGAAPRTRSWSLVTIAWIALGAVLYVAKPVVAPILFALLLALLLSPAVDFLVRYRIPRLVGALLAVGLVLGAIIIVGDAAWNPALRWVDSAPAVMQKVERKVLPLRRIVARVDSLTVRATSLTGPSTGKARGPIATPESGGMTAFGAGSILIEIATVAVLTILLLATGGRTVRKLEIDLAAHGGRLEYMHRVETVRSELSRYYSTLALINIGLGVVTTAIMALWGLPNPWLWGITACVLNFIPYAGPVMTLLVVTVVSLVSSDGYAITLGAAGSLLLVTTIEGQIIQPLLVGFRLNLNPIILFVSIWLAGWFWGVAGVFLVTPVLIAAKEFTARRSGVSVLRSILTQADSPSDTGLRVDELSFHQPPRDAKLDPPHDQM